MFHYITCTNSTEQTQKLCILFSCILVFVIPPPPNISAPPCSVEGQLTTGHPRLWQQHSNKARFNSISKKWQRNLGLVYQHSMHKTLVKDNLILRLFFIADHCPICPACIIRTFDLLLSIKLSILQQRNDVVCNILREKLPSGSHFVQPQVSKY